MEARAHVYISGEVQGCSSDTILGRWPSAWVCVAGSGTPPMAGLKPFSKGIKNPSRRRLTTATGPPGARVTDVEVKWEPHRFELKGFEIGYGRYGW